MRVGLLAIAGFLTMVTGCLGTDTTEAALGIEFELAPNQSTRVAGTELIIGFRRVAGDSRCPIDADCVVEGQAGIELEVFGGATSGPVLVTTPLPNDWTDGTYLVRVLDLLPYPSAGRPINPSEYRIRLLVELVPR